MTDTDIETTAPDLPSAETTSAPQHELDSAAKPVAKGSALAAIWEFAQTILLALALFFLIRNVVQNFRIDGISMEPNFHNGQFLIVNRFAYCPGLHFEVPLLKLKLNKTWCLNQPKRGDVVVFEYPLDTSRDFIKRVIALPGETVEVKSGQVHVNGTLMPEPFGPNPSGRNYGPLKVPPDTVFVMGDNRNNSSDSRVWGPLPQNDIIGKAILSYWPPQLWAIVPQYDLNNLSAAN